MEQLKLFDLEIYQLSHQLGEEIWELAVVWDYFSKSALGKQIVRSADSVSLNICEGYGRFFYKEKKLFFYYARGSLYETIEAVRKAYVRKLISQEKFEFLSGLMVELGRKLNNYIKTIGE
jgi:four helix bundle protein